MDVGLFLRDLGPLFHERDAGRLEFFVLLSQFGAGRLGLFAGDLERSLIGFVLRVQLGVFLLIAFDLLGRFARLLPIVLEVLASRFDGDPLIADVVLRRLDRLAFGLNAGRIGLVPRGLRLEVGRILVDLPAALFQLAMEPLDFGPLLGEGQFLFALAFEGGVDLLLPFGQRRFAFFQLGLPLVDLLHPGLKFDAGDGRLLGIAGELLGLFAERLPLFLEGLFLGEEFLLPRAKFVLLRTKLCLFLFEPFRRLAEFGGPLVGLLSLDEEDRAILFELRLLRV